MFSTVLRASSDRARSLQGLLAGALVVGVLIGLPRPAVADDPVPPPPEETSTTKLVRPDTVSARVTARSTGERVEDLSQRTAYQQIFANPDGSWTSETNTSPVRMQDDAGDWHAIDTTLVERDGSIEPKFALGDLTLSDGGDKTFASLTEGGKDVDWKWDGTLPAPVLDGNTATYKDAVPNGDLVVTALPNGFSHSVILRERPTGSVDITMPVVASGADVTQSASGGLVVKDESGDKLVTAPAPLMWDADAEGPAPKAGAEPVVDDTQTEVVDTTVDAGAGATSTVTLSPDDAFLQDPETTYPVTIDPTWTLYNSPSNETYVVSNGAAADGVNLRVGTTDSGGIKRRTLIKFTNPELNPNVHVLNASFYMWNWGTADCRGGYIHFQKLLGAWSPSTVTWANQPSATATDEQRFYPAYGASGCPSNRVPINLTNIVQDWAKYQNLNGIRLIPDNEASNYYYRTYMPTSYGGGTNAERPRLVVTYNTYPGTPAKPAVSGTASYSGNLYTANPSPTYSTQVPDAEGYTGALFEVFTTPNPSSSSERYAGCYTPKNLPQMTTVSCQMPKALVDNTTYWVRAKGVDLDGEYGGSCQTCAAGWSAMTQFSVAAKPAVPSVTCGQGNGTWGATPPSSPVSCTVSASGSATSAPVRVKWTVNNAPLKQADIAGGNGSASFTVPNADGGYSIKAYAESATGNISDPATYGFGFGKLGLLNLDPDRPTFTTGNLNLQALGRPSAGGTPSAKVQWRLASTSGVTTGWNDGGALALTDNGAAGVSVNGNWDTMSADHDAFANGGAGINLDDRKPTMLEVQLCVTNTGGSNAGTECTWAQTPRQVMRVPHAFGNGFPSTSAGPGEVALWTGELALSSTDVTIPGYTSSLSISRSHGTYAGPPASEAASVFGPGWVAQLDGPQAGLAGMQLLDGTRTDGTLVLQDGDGSVMVFGPEGGLSERLGPTVTSGAWVPLDEDTELAGVSATVSTVSATDQNLLVTFTEADGTATTFRSTAVPQTNYDVTFVPYSVDEPGAENTTTYAYDGARRVTSIVAPAPAGVTCTPGGTMQAGCRVLKLEYIDPATNGAPGAAGARLKTVYADIYKTPTGGTGPAVLDETKLLTYSYESASPYRLTSVLDERAQRATGYSYDPTSTTNATRLDTITPAGLKAFHFTYTGADNKLARVTRTKTTAPSQTSTATGDLSTLAAFSYDITHASTSSSLPAFDLATVRDGWAQTQAPTYAAAAFGPDAPSDLDPTSVKASDWPFADLYYTDDRGYTLNTAKYGAGAWQKTATEYDEHGNVTRSLDEGDIAAIADGTTAVANAGTRTTYNAEVKDTNGTVILPAGSVATDQYGPVRRAALPDGSVALLQPWTHTDYDEGAPNNRVNPVTGQRYALPTTVTTTAVDPGTQNVRETLSVSKSGYDTVGSLDPNAPAEGSGWALGQATTGTTVMGGSTADITTKTIYDTLGRVFETRQPKAADGTGAGVRRTRYYRATGTASASNCDGRPEWAGLVCDISYAASPSAGPALPTTRITDYTTLLQQPTAQTETSGSTVRTTTTTYKNDGQIWTSQVTSNQAGSTAVPGTSYAYDNATGLPTSVSNLDGSKPITTGYDTWGRATSYTPAAGEATTTTYDPAGRVAAVHEDSDNTDTTYVYDGQDADGKTERRGLPTQVTVASGINGGSGGSRASLTFTGAYDAQGALRTQVMPGGITQHTVIDPAGEPVGLTYSGDVTNNGVTTPDRPWIGWSQVNDVTGRVRLEVTPDGAALNGTVNGGGARSYSHTFGYDRAARLTTVVDNTAPAGAGGYTDPNNSTQTGNPSGSSCQTRLYDFDGNGNRTALTRRGANPDGSCLTTGGTTTSWSYDTADRLSTGYTYDNLGRATAVPAGDTPAGIAGIAGTTALGLGYYDTDAARTIAQNGNTTTYTLDTVGRRLGSSTAPTSGGSPTEAIDRHYSDSGDNPSWVTTTKSGTTTKTRYAESVGGDLAATIAQGGDRTLTLCNLHGDAISTVTVPASAYAAGIDNWVNSDEYGNPLTPASSPGANAVTGGVRYGWLGGKQRATDAGGLLLMGARLYNPASAAFTSVDPVPGGNSTSYAYPQDPVNKYDLDGRFSCKSKLCKRIGKGVQTGMDVVGFGPHRTYGVGGCILECVSVSYQWGSVTVAHGHGGMFDYSGHFAKGIRALHPKSIVAAYGYAGIARRPVSGTSHYWSGGASNEYGGYLSGSGRRVNEGGIMFGKGFYLGRFTSHTKKFF